MPVADVATRGVMRGRGPPQTSSRAARTKDVVGGTKREPSRVQRLGGLRAELRSRHCSRRSQRRLILWPFSAGRLMRCGSGGRSQGDMLIL